ncbi:MAG: glycoside hydrolase family 3 N-terminal domain-containing protein [Syntrophobacteraceae bacterium]|nr:glycoside hydrolase family 3 N-terminal domain-containing protein [Syntrophobacteraceae bacterium]
MSEAGIHLFIGFKGLSPDEELRRFIKEYRPAGAVLFKRNIESREQLKALVASAQALAMEELGHPLLFAIDQEGGSVQRLAVHFNSLPSAQSLAEEGPESVARWAAICAGDLREIGVRINFAPVLDIVADPGSHFMTSRSFGSTPEQVSELGTVWIETLQAKGISATAKHFPGLGRASLDPHHFAPVIADEREEDFRLDLVPFGAAVKAGVHCMMTSHAVYRSVDPARPATFSNEICRVWLRERMGFGGVLFADDLDMAAIAENYSPEESARLGLECSIDFFLLCQKSENIEPMYRALSDQLKGDSSLQDFHRDSVQRIERLRHFHESGN